jgi:hypothetical protein
MAEQDLAEMLRKLADLHGAGAMSAEDFHRAKTRLLAPPVAPAEPPAWPEIPAPRAAGPPERQSPYSGIPAPPHPGFRPPEGTSSRPSPSVVLGVIGGLVAMTALTVAVVALVPPLGGGSATAGSSSAQSGGSAVRPSPTFIRPAPTTPSRSASAQEVLDQIVAADRAAVDALEGAWVPQLWSKQVGLEADGIVYDIEAILTSYRSLADRRSGTLLLRSDDYGSFRHGGFYVAVVPLAFESGEDVLEWCTSEQLGRDDCIAKRIMRTGSPEGSSMYPP